MKPLRIAICGGCVLAVIYLTLQTNTARRPTSLPGTTAGESAGSRTAARTASAVEPESVPSAELEINGDRPGRKTPAPRNGAVRTTPAAEPEDPAAIAHETVLSFASAAISGERDRDPSNNSGRWQIAPPVQNEQ